MYRIRSRDLRMASVQDDLTSQPGGLQNFVTILQRHSYQATHTEAGIRTTLALIIPETGDDGTREPRNERGYKTSFPSRSCHLSVVAGFFNNFYLVTLYPLHPKHSFTDSAG